MGSVSFPGIDAAISKFEGFGTPQAPSITQANNPGAIQFGQFAAAHGATGSLNGFAIFPDTTTGTAAEDALVKSYADQGLTIDQMINSWAPPNAPGNSLDSTKNYVNSVAASMGVTPDTTVASLQGAGSPVAGSPSLLSKITSAALFGPGYSWARVGAFLLGLVLIVAGLYLFKPPAALNVSPGPIGRGINRAGKTAARAAAAAV
jgi:hypothetical protein